MDHFGTAPLMYWHACGMVDMEKLLQLWKTKAGTEEKNNWKNESNRQCKFSCLKANRKSSISNFYSFLISTSSEAMYGEVPKLRKVEDLRRSVPFCSRACLEKILDFAATEGIPELHSRKHQREACRQKINAWDNMVPWSCLHQQFCPKTHILHANVLTYIAGAYSENGGWTSLIDIRLRLGGNHLCWWGPSRKPAGKLQQKNVVHLHVICGIPKCSFKWISLACCHVEKEFWGQLLRLWHQPMYQNHFEANFLFWEWITFRWFVFESWWQGNEAALYIENVFAGWQWTEDGILQQAGCRLKSVHALQEHILYRQGWSGATGI